MENPAEIGRPTLKDYVRVLLTLFGWSVPFGVLFLALFTLGGVR